jgi:hypothetical protein
VLALRERSFILDGEIVVPVKGGFSFDDLLQRIHPAASRVKKLAEQTPALFLAFDLLKKGKTEIGDKPRKAAACLAEDARRRNRCRVYARLCLAEDARRRNRCRVTRLEDFAALFCGRKSFSALASQPEAAGCAALARVGRRRKRRRDRETRRSSLSGRQSRWHAKDKALPKRGLRHRRVPLWRKTSSRPEGYWFDSSRPL